MKEIQEEEVAAIKAIYDNDVQDLRVFDNWKIERSPELQIHIEPSKGMDRKGAMCYVSADIHFHCPDDYPMIAPNILIENAKGLSDKQQIELTTILVETAKSMRGECMLLQLCQITQDYLAECNLPPHVVPSFYEGMNTNQQLKSQMVEYQRVESEKEEADRIRDQLKHKQERRNEVSKFVKPNAQPFTSISDTSEKSSVSICEETLKPDLTDTRLINILYLNGKEHTIHELKMGMSLRTCCHSLVHEFIGFDSTTNNYVLVSEWNFNPNDSKMTRKSTKTKPISMQISSDAICNAIKQLRAVRQEAVALSKLPHSPHVAALLALHFVYNDSANQKKKTKTANNGEQLPLLVFYVQSLNNGDQRAMNFNTSILYPFFTARVI